MFPQALTPFSIGQIVKRYVKVTLPGKVDSMEEASLSLGVHDDQAEANK